MGNFALSIFAEGNIAAPLEEKEAAAGIIL